MNEYFAEAERALKMARDDITRIVNPSQTKEDISYYNHIAIDGIIDLVIKAKTLMGIGRLVDEYSTTKETV